MLKKILYVFYLLIILELLARAILTFTPFIDSIRVDRSDAWWCLHHFYSKDVKKIIPEISDQGLRGPRQYSYEHPAGKIRILALGDSFTYGYHLKDNETWPYLLEDRLGAHYEVLNLGRNGISHCKMEELLKEQGLKFHPDICILGFVTSDMVRNILNFRQHTKALDKEKRYHKPVLFYLLWLLYDECYGMQKSYPLEQKATIVALDSILNTLKENNIRPVFVYIPIPRELGRYSEYYSKGEHLVASYCLDRHVECLDLTGDFKKALREDNGLPGSGHWNKEGNEIIAGSLKSYILK